MLWICETKPGSIYVQDIFGNTLMVKSNHLVVKKEDFNMIVCDAKVLNVPKHPSKVMAK